MNDEVFKGWFVSILCSLEEGFIIVVDNATYHYMQADKPRV